MKDERYMLRVAFQVVHLSACVCFHVYVFTSSHQALIANLFKTTLGTTPGLLM